MEETTSQYPAIKQAFVLLTFPMGETCQFDGSQKTVMLGGVLQIIKLAHFRLAYSRRMFVVVYSRETQDMILDVHSSGKIISCTKDTKSFK